MSCRPGGGAVNVAVRRRELRLVEQAAAACCVCVDGGVGRAGVALTSFAVSLFFGVPATVLRMALLRLVTASAFINFNEFMGVVTETSCFFCYNTKRRSSTPRRIRGKVTPSPQLEPDSRREGGLGLGMVWRVSQAHFRQERPQGGRSKKIFGRGTKWRFWKFTTKFTLATYHT